MKKFMPLVIMLCCALLFGACSSDLDYEEKTYTDESGNFVIENYMGKTVLTSQLPIDIPYNGSAVTLKSVKFYQNSPNYSYNLFIVTTLDASALSDDQLHWLQRSDLRIYEHITSEKNDYDSELASSLGNVLFSDTKELVFVSTSSFFNENRYSFADSKISVSVEIEQEETYEHADNGEEINKSEEVSYDTTTGSVLPDVEEMDSRLYPYVTKWLVDKAKLYQSFTS